MQLLTATGGVMGACCALFINTDALTSSGVSWILPFTAGGFINIALVQILPELMEETNPRLEYAIYITLIFPKKSTRH